MIRALVNSQQQGNGVRYQVAKDHVEALRARCHPGGKIEHPRDCAGRAQMLRNLHRQPGAVHPQLQLAVFGFLETACVIVMRGKHGHPMPGGAQIGGET